MSEEIKPYKTPYFLNSAIISSLYSFFTIVIDDYLDFTIEVFIIESLVIYLLSGLIALPIWFLDKKKRFSKVLFFSILIIGALRCYGVYIMN